MKRNNKRIAAMAAVALLLAQTLSACTPAGQTGRDAPTATPAQQTATPAPNKNNTPAAAAAAQQALVTTLGVSAADVQITSVEIRQWRNGCLELEVPDEMCTQAIVPGYLVILKANGQTYTYHTDQDGSRLRLAPASAPTPASSRSADVALIWHREGGIAGFCDDLSITANGVVSGASCKGKPGSNVLAASLDANQQMQLTTWLNQYAPIDYRMKDPATADAMLQTLVLKGNGQTTATDADISALLAWVSGIYQAAKGAAPATIGASTPSLTVQPGEGGLLSQVALHGENWPAGQKVNIHLASATVAFDAAQVFAASAADAAGRFDVSVTAPATWPGGAAISDAVLTWIASTPDGQIKATADFSVTQ